MKILHITGRRWFEGTNGNTYHTVSVYVDGEQVYKSPLNYGYDRQYEQTAQDWLSENDYLKGIRQYPNGSIDPLWHYCRELNIKFVSEVVDVPRKKDL